MSCPAVKLSISERVWKYTDELSNCTWTPVTGEPVSLVTVPRTVIVAVGVA